MCCTILYSAYFLSYYLLLINKRYKTISFLPNSLRGSLASVISWAKPIFHKQIHKNNRLYTYSMCNYSGLLNKLNYLYSDFLLCAE